MLAHHKKFKNKCLTLALCSAFFVPSFAHADTHFGHDSHTESSDDVGLIESLTGFKYNKTSFAESLGVKFGGWTEIGFSGNVSNGKTANGPVTFNDGPNEFKLHQVYGIIEREVNKNTDTWSFGFRADILYGTDARFSSAANFDSNILNSTATRQLVFPQAYVDIFMPIGNGVTAQVGHFYTIIGYEVVPSAGNFFFSHAYTMQYGEPFTHSGMLLTYPVNDNITVKGGVVTGWDAHFKQPANFLGNVNYTTDDERTSFTASLITGSVRAAGLGTSSDHNRTMYSLVLEHDITDRWHYVIQHDLGVEEKNVLTGRSSQWYGLNQYLFYDVLHNLGAGIRMEWFRDDDGTRIPVNGVSGIPGTYIGVTGGLNYTPIEGFIIRPEVRYDRSTSNKAFHNGADDDQMMLSLSGIFRF
ncbi:MAG: porin [Nitrosomonas sp.]|nr:porin [Nitrosomonas sp.]